MCFYLAPVLETIKHENLHVYRTSYELVSLFHFYLLFQGVFAGVIIFPENTKKNTKIEG